LQENLAAIQATGTQLIGVSYDPVEVLQAFAEGAEITFPLLSEPDSAIINAFGIHNQKGFPHPGTYVIGPNREVLAAIFLEGYVKRHTPEDLLTTIRDAATQ
jgi:peroxiredoxin Q/BCP